MIAAASRQSHPVDRLICSPRLSCKASSAGTWPRGPARLVIDLTHTSFLGASALSVLLNIRRAATQQGTSLNLRAPTRPVQARALHLAGLDRLCDIASPSTDTDRPPGPVLHGDCGACFAALSRGEDALWLNAIVPHHRVRRAEICHRYGRG